jgi:hypothetical protein
VIEHISKQLAPAIIRNRNLTIEDLKTLNLPLIFQENLVIIEKSTIGWKLKTPIAIELNKILAAGEKGLVDYIICSCIRQQPALIPYIFENQTPTQVSSPLSTSLPKLTFQLQKLYCRRQKIRYLARIQTRFNYRRHKASRRNPRPSTSPESLRLHQRLSCRSPRLRPLTWRRQQLHQSRKNLLPR